MKSNVGIIMLILLVHKYEVTNAQFVKFLNDRSNKRDNGVERIKLDDLSGIERDGNRFRVVLGHDLHPVVQVSWYAARAHCEWVGKRLPNEDEWVQACEGDNGRMYPWGNVFEANRANVEGLEGRTPTTSYVGQFLMGASPYGVMDMAGNVWEWTATLGEDNTRLVRGGSFNNIPDDVKCSSLLRLAPTERGGNVGFRCVK